MTESAAAKTCPECGLIQDHSGSRRALTGWWLWLPIAFALATLVVLLWLGMRSPVTTPQRGPLPADWLEQTRGVYIDPLPTLGNLRRLARDGNADVDMKDLADCTSARTMFPMPEESTVRVAAVEGLRIAEYRETWFGWPVRFVSASMQQGVDVREPKENAAIFSRAIDRWDWSWREIGRYWQDADGRSRSIVIHWTALCVAALVIASVVLARYAIDARRYKARRLVMWAGLILAVGALAIPARSTNKAATVGFPMGQAAPTGYTLGHLRNALSTPDGRAAFARAVVSVVESELVAASSSTGVFFRRTREFDGGPNDTGPLRTTAPAPPQGWPDSTGIVFFVTSPPTKTVSQIDRWGEKGRWVVSRFAWNETLPARYLGVEAGASLFSWSIRWTRNVGGAGEKWVLAVDRLAEWLGLALVIPIGFLALRAIWFERRVRRRVDRGQCVGCGYSLIGLPQSTQNAPN